MNSFCARKFFSACLIGVFSLAINEHALAAPKVKPPLESVRRDDVSSVIGQLQSVDLANGQLEFKVTRVIAGSAALGNAKIAASADILSRIAPDTDYTLLVLDRMVDPRKPGRIVSLDVWQLFETEGASPPIFLTNEENTALFEPAHIQVERSANYLAQVVNDLSSKDVQLVDLSAAEILYSEPRIAALTSADTDKLVALIARTDLRGITRARVLSAASAGIITTDAGQLNQLVKQVLLSAPMGQLPWIDSQDELVFAALSHFNRQVQLSGAIKVADLSRWLQSHNPALVEQAALLAIRIDPEQAADAIRAALNYSLLPKVARTTLLVVLHRNSQ